MQSEIALDAFRYFDRATLEGLQMHSRYLRDIVNRHARTLPLRYIHHLATAYGKVNMFLLEDDEDGFEVVAPAEEDLETLFRRVNNAFIHRLVIDFLPKDLPLPHYLWANADDLQCQARALSFRETEERIDYALVDFLAAHLKPRVCETWSVNELSEDYAMLFTCDALRGNVTHLVYDIEECPAPDCLIPELFGADVVETCAITTNVDPCPWIRKLIQMFEAAERGTNIAPSVTLVHTHYGQEFPLHNAGDALGQPRRSDIPTPHNAFIKEWSRRYRSFSDITESPSAELFVFENAKVAKTLEIFVWTLEQVDKDDGEISLHHAFLLQIVDV